jgi:hypothetical protein
MPKLSGIGIQYEQIVELLHQLESEKQMTLMKAIMSKHEYQENFYRDIEDFRKKHKIPLIKKELDVFL